MAEGEGGGRAEMPSLKEQIRMIITTGNDVAGQTIVAYLGIVRGIVVRAPSISQGFAGGLQRMAGGNIDAWTEVCEAARRDAFQRMWQHAQQLGADAIIGMRYDATEFADGVNEVLAYGTAVKLSGNASAAPAEEIRFTA
jgi:uncharacterized protein YbjQ (UPF0145 family)